LVSLVITGARVHYKHVLKVYALVMHDGTTYTTGATDVSCNVCESIG
jgi:hypothetical protein